MSALGQKRTHAAQQKGSLFDNFVSAGKERRWHSKAKRLRGLEVDDQFILRRLLIRQIAGLFATKNTVDVGRAATVKVDTIRSVIDQATNFHRRRLRIDRRKAMPGNDSYDLR